MGKRERASIAPERLGRALRGRDVLIPSAPAPVHVPVESVTERVADFPVEPGNTLLASAKAEPAPVGASVEREPITVRLTKPTLRRLARTRLEMMEASDLKVSQSDLIEAAIWTLLEKPHEIEASLRRLQTGMLFKTA